MQWRSVVIGVVSTVTSLLILLITVGYHGPIVAHLQSKLAENQCYIFSTTTARAVNWSSTMMTKENDCVYLAFSSLFPWPLWTTLLAFMALNANLIISALYKWIPGVIVYLATDALFLGLMATALCLSFFPDGLTRIALLTVLFPLLSLALCAWMTVFGFYLRLEDLAERARKRQLARKAVERGANQYWNGGSPDLKGHHISTDFVNLAFELEEENTINKVTRPVKKGASL